MHNSVGLQSSRGSGTNGFVRKNLAHHVRSKDRDSLKKLNETSGSSLRKLNSDIAEHDRKRKLEVKCLELQQMLEDQECPEDEIEKRVSSYRLSLIQESTSNATKDKHKRTRTKEILENAASQSRKSNQLREAFDISERFVGVSNASNIEPEQRANEAAVEQTAYAQIAPSPSSEEEEGEIAEERSSRKTKKRSRKSSSPKADSKKKKKKKKKHKRKSKSDSQRKKKSRHKDKHDHRNETPEQSSEYEEEDEVDERYEESRSRRRSETPEQYRQRPASHRAKEKFSKMSDFRQYRQNIVDDRIRCSDLGRKRRSQTPEHVSFEKRGVHHSEAKAHKKRKRASSRRSPSTEDIDDYCSTSSTTKRRPQCSETPPPVDQKCSFYDDVEVKSFERRKQRRSPTPKKYSLGRGAHHSEDRASKKDKMRPFPEPSTSAIDARYSRLTSLSSKQFFHETNSKMSRIRHSSSPEAAENGRGHDRSRTTQARSSEVATKRTKKDEKNDRRNEKSLVLRYFDSESDEAEESECGTTTVCKNDENDLTKRQMSPLPTLLQRQTHQDTKSCGLPEPSLSHSPLANSSQPGAVGVRSDVPKKTDGISNKETFHCQVVEEMPNNGRANVEREMASKSKLAVEHIEDKSNKIKFETIGKSHKKVESRVDEEEVVSRSSKVDPIVQPKSHHRSPDKGNSKVEEQGVESNSKVVPSAADMVDEAVKKTMTALALNRDKTLTSLRKLLSCSLPKSKEGASGSSLKTSRKERRSVSSSSDSGSSDSSQSSRSRNLSTSSSENSSESSNNCSRASSRAGRKRKNRSGLPTKMSRGSRRRSSSKLSDMSGSRSSGSRNSSSSGEEKTKKRRKTDRSSSSSSSCSSRSRSTSIPRRKGSPSFLKRRRITSNKKKKRSSSSSASTSSDSSARSSLSSSE